MGRNSLLTAVGLAASGTSTVVITAASSRSFPGPEFASFSVWWTLALTVGLAFTVLETYLPKALGDALLHGDGRPVQRTMARRVGASMALVALAAAMTAPLTLNRWFSGSVILLLLDVMYVGVLALQSFQRGVAVARGQFAALTVQLGTDGALRVLLSLSLILVGRANPETMASAIVLSGAVSLGVARARTRGWWAWRGAHLALPWFPLVALFVAALGPSVMNNATVPWLSAQPGTDPYTVGAFAGALGLSRLPIMFVGAVYAPLIRPLADATARQDHHAFGRTYRAAIAIGAGLAVLSAVIGWVLGPWLVSLYLGHQYSISHDVAAILALTGGLGLMGAGSQAAVVAQGTWEANPRASLIGLVAFGLVLAVQPWSPTLTAASAGLTGIGLIVLVMMSHVRGVPWDPRRRTDGPQAQKGRASS